MSGIIVLSVLIILSMTPIPKDVLIICGIYTVARVYKNRYDTPVMNILDCVLAFLIYTGTKKVFGIQLNAEMTVYEKGLLVVLASVPMWSTPTLLALIKGMVNIVRYKVRNINYSFDAARITSHLPFSQEELVELGVSCRSDYIKLLYKAVLAVSTREAVSAARIADIVCNTRGEKICNDLNHLDTKHEKKDIFILYKDRELVNKCLDTVDIENIDCRSAVAYFVLKGCVGDKLSTSDLKKLITEFIIWR